MAMNTGLSLRRFGETSYGRYRRFVLANSLITSYGLSKISSVKIAATEKDFCEKYRIEYIEPCDMIGPSKSSSIRACDYCLKSGYHSKYFACQWLKYCPVHSREISDRCSECGQPWPSESEMLSRNCKTCGRWTRLSDLKDTRAFEVELFKYKFGPLVELEFLYNSSHFWDLYSSFGSEETSNWHRSDSLYSATLPDSFTSFYPHIKPIFVSLRASRMEPYQVSSFDIDESISLLEWSKKVGDVVDKAIKAVSRLIRRKYAGESLSINPIDAEHLNSDAMTLIKTFGVESLSYSVWRLIIDPQIRQTYKQRTLRTLYNGYYHLKPTPMNLYGAQGNAADQLANLRYSYHDPWTHGCSIACPPPNLVGLVYKIDLIACFNEVHRYFDGFLGNSDANGAVFLPSRESYSGGVLMKLKSDKRSIELSFPKSLNSLPLDKSRI